MNCCWKALSLQFSTLEAHSECKISSLNKLSYGTLAHFNQGFIYDAWMRPLRILETGISPHSSHQEKRKMIGPLFQWPCVTMVTIHMTYQGIWLRHANSSHCVVNKSYCAFNVIRGTIPESNMPQAFQEEMSKKGSLKFTGYT